MIYNVFFKFDFLVRIILLIIFNNSVACEDKFTKFSSEIKSVFLNNSSQNNVSSHSFCAIAFLWIKSKSD
jgi:hypothetical protein